MFGDVRQAFRTILENLRKYSGKWSEIFGKSSKTSLLVCLYNKQNNTWTLGDMEFIFSYSHSISHSFAALTRSISMWTLEDKFHIYARPCIILYLIGSQSKLSLESFKANRYFWTIYDQISRPLLHSFKDVSCPGRNETLRSGLTKIDRWILGATFIFSLYNYTNLFVPPQVISVLGLIRSMVKISKKWKKIDPVNLPVVIQFLARGSCNWRKFSSYKALVTKKEKPNDRLKSLNKTLLHLVYLAGAAATLRCFQLMRRDFPASFPTSFPKSSWRYRHLSHHSCQSRYLVIKKHLNCCSLVRDLQWPKTTNINRSIHRQSRKHFQCTLT